MVTIDFDVYESPLFRKEDCMNSTIKKALLAVLIVLSALFFVACADNSNEDIIMSDESMTQLSDDNTNNNKYICVYICGQVKNPGVYEVSSESRLFEVVKKAGGFTKKADEASINLAQIAMDGQMVVVPAEQGNKDSVSTDSDMTSDSDSGKINLNTAGADELMTLSGIGEVKAQSIIAYREQSGAYKAIEDVMNVSGIGEATFDNIKDQVTVN